MAQALGAVAHSKQPMLTVQLEKVQRSIATLPISVLLASENKRVLRLAEQVVLGTWVP